MAKPASRADLFDMEDDDKSSKNYSAKDIEVLEGLEPVRRRPGMYIGGTDERALHHLAAEIVDNAMDEAVAGHATRIEIELAEGNVMTVRDNGRGIPVDSHSKFKNKSALEVIMTTLHSGGKFTAGAYETSGGLHGVGSSVVNALSEWLEVEVARDRGLPRASWERRGSRQEALRWVRRSGHDFTAPGRTDKQARTYPSCHRGCWQVSPFRRRGKMDSIRIAF